jgi:hypothetical protein
VAGWHDKGERRSRRSERCLGVVVLPIPPWVGVSFRSLAASSRGLSLRELVRYEMVVVVSWGAQVLLWFMHVYLSCSISTFINCEVGRRHRMLLSFVLSLL